MTPHPDPPSPEPSVVPRPLVVAMSGAPAFVLGPRTRVVVGHVPQAVTVAVLVAQRIGRVEGFPVAVVGADDGAPGAIVLRLTDLRSDVGLGDDIPVALADEGYRVEVTEDRATVTALTPAGLLHGAFTLQQMATQDGPNAPWTFAAGVVVDHPRFAWRGLTLDVARHFVGVQDVRSVIDVMASLKLNVLHLHLTDDQGWRLEVPSRPELTAASGTTAVDGDPAGFYTAADYVEILTHAASRHVTVVPEVDVPGHVHAALHACPELNPDGLAPPAYQGRGGGFSRLHPELPGTSVFLADVMDAVAAMTPGPFVHLGGDEVPDMDPVAYAAVLQAAADVLRSAGKTVVAWQEAAQVGESVGVLQYWHEGTDPAPLVAAARAGARVVLSPASKVYLDLAHDEHDVLGDDWAGHVDLRDAYLWEPSEVLPELPDAQVLGVEAAMWTGAVRTRDELFGMLLPRLAAVAEVAWSAPGRRDWDSFARRIPAHTRRWDAAAMAWYPSRQVEW